LFSVDSVDSSSDESSESEEEEEDRESVDVFLEEEEKSGCLFRMALWSAGPRGILSRLSSPFDLVELRPIFLLEDLVCVKVIWTSAADNSKGQIFVKEVTLLNFYQYLLEIWVRFLYFGYRHFVGKFLERRSEFRYLPDLHSWAVIR
jgi:hypothetical protein